MDVVVAETVTPWNGGHAPPFRAGVKPVTVYVFVPVVPHAVAVHPSVGVYEQSTGDGGGGAPAGNADGIAKHVFPLVVYGVIADKSLQV